MNTKIIQLTKINDTEYIFPDKTITHKNRTYT